MAALTRKVTGVPAPPGGTAAARRSGPWPDTVAEAPADRRPGPDDVPDTGVLWHPRDGAAGAGAAGVPGAGSPPRRHGDR